MVTLNNAGRLGNYLYEFACAWSYAKKYDLEFTAPLCDRDPKWCPIYFKEYQNFNYNQSLPKVHLWESGHHYQELPFDESYRSMNVIVEGYRQSFRYFDEYRGELLSVFNLPYERNDKVCSLHIRRGDYLLYPTKHPVITEQYILCAMKYIQSEADIKKFIVFSDDIRWAMQFFYYAQLPIEIEFSQGKSEIEDLILMSNCEHNICSNSTMSVWAAEINQNPDKIVILPSEDNWFGIDNKHLDIHDLYRPEWVQVEY